MEKEKRYDQTRFSTEAIREAGRRLEALASDSPSAETYYRVRVSNTESWAYDSEEEFFTAYTEGFTRADYRRQLGSFSLSVFATSDSTEVSVRAHDRTQVDSVFAVFEDAASDSRLPAEPTSPEIAIFGETESIFELEKTLPSCSVNRSLLEELERFVLDELPSIAGVPPAVVRNNYSLAISDSAGTETLTSVSRWLGPHFSDSTSRVELRLRAYSPRQIAFRVRFDRQKLFSDLSLETSGDNARPIASALSSGAIERISRFKNLNSIYHLPAVIEGLFFGLGFPTAAISAALLARGAYLQGAALLSVGSIVAVLFFGKRANPYCEFHSTSQDRWNRFWSWFLYGLLGFLLFGTALAYFREWFLGQSAA